MPNPWMKNIFWNPATNPYAAMKAGAEFGNSWSNTIIGHIAIEAKELRRNKHAYEEGESFDSKPMGEENILKSTNLYAATKAGEEFLVKSYHR